MRQETVTTDQNEPSSFVADRLKHVQDMSPDAARAFARAADWAAEPNAVLAWLMAQKFMDLGTALSVFFKGQPERLNYVPKRDVPGELRGAAQVLDTICLRLNSGFYLVWPDQDVEDRQQLLQWLQTQKRDRDDGRQGRFVLDERIVTTLLDNELRLDPEKETAVYFKRRSLLRDLFSPVLELGVNRRILRFHPPQDDPSDDLSKLRF